jgi:hypothetical protein
VSASNRKIKEDFAYWASQPASLRSSRHYIPPNSDVFAEATKVQSTGVPESVDPLIMQTPPSLRSIVDPTISFFAVKYRFWLAQERNDPEFLDRFCSVPNSFDGNLAHAIVYDIGSIKSFEWARQVLENAARDDSTPSILIGVWGTDSKVCFFLSCS